MLWFLFRSFKTAAFDEMFMTRGALNFFFSCSCPGSFLFQEDLFCCKILVVIQKKKNPNLNFTWILKFLLSAIDNAVLSLAKWANFDIQSETVFSKISHCHSLLSVVLKVQVALQLADTSVL